MPDLKSAPPNYPNLLVKTLTRNFVQSIVMRYGTKEYKAQKRIDIKHEKNKLK